MNSKNANYFRAYIFRMTINFVDSFRQAHIHTLICVPRWDVIAGGTDFLFAQIHIVTIKHAQVCCLQLM